MRLLRHLTSAGPAYAALQPDGTAREVTGDPFANTHRVTDRVVTLGNDSPRSSSPALLLRPALNGRRLSVALISLVHQQATP